MRGKRRTPGVERENIDGGSYNIGLGNYFPELGKYNIDLGSYFPDLGSYTSYLGSYSPTLGMYNIPDKRDRRRARHTARIPSRCRGAV